MAATLLVLAALALLFLGWEFRRAARRLERGGRRVDEAWDQAERTFRARLHVLEEFLASLRRAGYVPEGQRELRALLDEARSAELNPRSVAKLDEQLRVVLWRIFAALPRERPQYLRESQNRLAEAAEEYDLARRRYNDLARSWNGLLLRFPYRFVAARRRLSPRDLLPVRSEWELL
ncbi:hypothetical protein ACVNPS_06090 [Candidatus Bipolaricaulota sp. J31]